MIARKPRPAAYLEEVQDRAWAAFLEEMEAEPFTAERGKLAHRARRLASLRRALLSA